MDQDVGWQQPWQSFYGLQQFANWRRDLIFYPSGIRPNRYYELKSEVSGVKRERDKALADRAVLESVAKRLERETAIDGLSFDASGYEHAIHNLLGSLKSLREKRAAYASRLASIIQERVAITEQLAIVQRALKEFDAMLAGLLSTVKNTFYALSVAQSTRTISARALHFGRSRGLSFVSPGASG